MTNCGYQRDDASLTTDDTSIDYVSLSRRSPHSSLSELKRATGPDEYSARPCLRSPCFTSCFRVLFFSPVDVRDLIHGLMFVFMPHINVAFSVSQACQLNAPKCDFSRERARNLADKNDTKSKFRDSLTSDLLMYWRRGKRIQGTM